MTEFEIKAQMKALSDQRNASQDEVALLIGKLAGAGAEIMELRKQIEESKDKDGS
tara:strand:+ start:279 stop:443 length:165 start_codon:yes stop_codon:yes gene_type:complete